MNNENKSGKGLSIFLLVVEIAFVCVVVARKYIFSPESLFFNLYEADMAGNVLVRILKTALALCAGGVFGKVADAITLLGEKSGSNKTKTLMLLLGNVAKYASVVAVIFICLAAWGIDTTAIATGAGVVTLIVGLGCQSMISDVVAGIFMLLEGDIQVGDIVVINGWRGEVQQIGLRRTRIMDSVGNINIVNNSSITNIINNTRELSYTINDVGIDYSESIERVEKVLKDNLAKIKEDIPAIVEGPFYMGVAALGSSSVTVRILAKVQEVDKFQAERDINRAIKLLFDRENIQIPFDQITVSQRVEKEDVALSNKELMEVKAFLEEQREHTKNIEEQQM